MWGEANGPIGFQTSQGVVAGTTWLFPARRRELERLQAEGALEILPAYRPG